MKCTCGPHPRIDLTGAAARCDIERDESSSVGGGDGENTARFLRERVREACRSHGCFHVTIDVRAVSSSDPSPVRSSEPEGIGNAPPPTSLGCLAASSEEVGRDVETLFSREFLEDVLRSHRIEGASNCNGSASDDDEGDDNDNGWEHICNGGMHEVSFPAEPSLRDGVVASKITRGVANLGNPQNMHRAAATATFRGRTAESGDGENSSPEPKLSWEFRRCTNVIINSGTMTRQPTSSEKLDGPGEFNETWKLLPRWTEALHAVASLVIDLLDIPPSLVLREGRCRCTSKDDGSSIELARGCCNIDLLRVFRYDAVPPPKRNDETTTDDVDPVVMGSSAHSDWGTLTVVWQDTKGGLQTYCHECDKWSDVDAASAQSSSSDGGIASVFVHVGDFLSLATSDGEGGDGDVPVWPSPRHRVKCPTTGKGVTDSSRVADSCEECRRSLVYFAYPPPGVSLDDVRRVVSPLASTPSGRSPSSSTTSVVDGAKRDAAAAIGTVYDTYSLLHDQSHREESSLAKERGGDLTSSLRTHERMRSIPFDRVISEKWNQVQRK